MSDMAFNIVALGVLGAIAWHGLTYKDADDQRPFVHLLFGCIALLYAFRILFSEIFRVW